MLIYPENEIDKKLLEVFSKEELENVSEENLDFIGITVSTQVDKDMVYKIYYSNAYSIEEYRKQNYKIPFVDYLLNNNLIDCFNIVRENSTDSVTKFNLAPNEENKDAIAKIYEYFEHNVDYFQKYKDEILELSKIKNASDSSNIEDYALFFLGFQYEGEKINALKFYFWNSDVYNETAENKGDPLGFIKNSNVAAFRELVPVTDEFLKICSGQIESTGVNYREDKACKHKIYVTRLKNLYDALINIFSENNDFVDKINTIRKWHELHTEMYCDGIAIGRDEKDQVFFNIYYSLLRSEDSMLSPTIKP